MKWLGIDWAHRAHVAVLLDSKGALAATRSFDNCGPDVAAFLSWLASEGGPDSIRVAIESGASLLVEQLLHRGYRVYSFNPKQAERCRDRLCASPAKDDPRDAHAIAEALRTDSQGVYRPLEREPACVEELKLLDSARQRRVESRVRASNQLWDVLQHYYPGLFALQRPCHDPFLLALLRAYPTPAQGAKATRARVARLLKTHRVRALRSQAVVSALHAEGFFVPEHIASAHSKQALLLAEEIELANEQIKELDRCIEGLFEQHPDRAVLSSLPGLGRTLAARVGARIGTKRDPVTGLARVGVRGGTAPITRRSGERPRDGRRLPSSISVRMRRACDRTLQTALFGMARASLRTSAWAKACYQAHISRGASHAVAIRSLSNKWAKILDHLLAEHAEYDEATHVRHLKRRNVPWAAELQITESAA